MTVLIPAHNEADRIGAALAALARQTVQPDRVVVVADNCTDQTAAVARAHGALVFEPTDNSDKKAGALNQALTELLLLDHERPGDFVLVQDADSVPSEAWIEHALTRFAERPDLGAVGGVFVGEQGGGLLGALQRMEYCRYARELARTGKVWVLTGTATMFRAEALAEVAASRGDQLPGRRGDPYNRNALTEDMEVTVALRTLGWRIASPSACRVTTEVMPTVRDLWRQRIRWQRGALENLRSYGWRRSTRPYFRQQALMALSVLAMGLFLGMSVFWVATGQWESSWLWGGVAALFVTERMATVWPLGLRHRLIATPLVIELIYDLFQQVVLVRAAADSLLARPQRWHHHVAAVH